MRSSVVLVALVLAIVAGVAAAAKRDWTGSAACGACHPKQLASWQATRHAMTRDRFPGRPEARCLACHGTGEAPAGPAIAVEVGCEACHGAGAAYAADDLMRDLPVARSLGLADLSAPKQRTALCMQCHSRPSRGRKLDLSLPVHPLSKTP